AAGTPYVDRLSGLERMSRLAELGRAAAARHGCFQCHTVDGSPGDGPTWLNLYGARETMQTGEVVYVNPTYITQSMMDPTAEIVAGFPPIMPSFQGRITPAEDAAIIEYMKALSPAPGLRRGGETAPAGAIAPPPGDTLTLPQVRNRPFRRGPSRRIMGPLKPHARRPRGRPGREEP